MRRCPRWSRQKTGAGPSSVAARTSPPCGAARGRLERGLRPRVRRGIAARLPPLSNCAQAPPSSPRTCFAIAPAACYLPAACATRAASGVRRVQLYGVRSERNWGIGDFTDLGTLIDQWGARGAGVVGVNPLHALYPHKPRHASPYSPSSRLFRNILYIDVEAVAEFRDCDEARARVLATGFQDRLAALRDAPLVDYAASRRPSCRCCECLYQHFRERHLATGERAPRLFAPIVEAGGEALASPRPLRGAAGALPCGRPAVWGWPAWPRTYRDPHAPAVARFAADHAGRIEFYAYLQWQAEQQFAAAGARAGRRPVGRPLRRPRRLDRPRRRGSLGQPGSLRARRACRRAARRVQPEGPGLGPAADDSQPASRHAAYAPFIATLRANMRHAGALRIDHVMGLMRLFWVPAGHVARRGRLRPLPVRRPARPGRARKPPPPLHGDRRGSRNRAGRRARGAGRQRRAVVSRAASSNATPEQDFKPPDAYPAEALVTASTHDLPTLAGWWDGSDIDLRAAQGLTRPTAIATRRPPSAAANGRSSCRRWSATACCPRASPPIRRRRRQWRRRSPARLPPIWPQRHRA